MTILITSDTTTNIDELGKLYDDLNDYLETTTNYSGWKIGIYPIRECAVAGIHDKSLYVVRSDGKIIVSIILDPHPDKVYQMAKWKLDVAYSHIFVIRTFVVHPSFLKGE